MHAKNLLVNNRQIGLGMPSYLIAEIGSNHNQDKGLALEMISMAAEAGADAVKFQSIQFDRLYKSSYESNEFREWFKLIELDESWYFDLAERARKLNIDFISAPTYPEAIDLLEACNVPAYKLASPQVYGNLDLVRMAARTGKPLFLSVGYCDYGDIAKALIACKEEGNLNTIFLHCVSEYPTSMQDANLKFINTLGLMTGGLVGFSDHSLGHHLTVAAVAMGACVIEKHITTDRRLPGPDHHFALQLDEFAEMVRQIRDIEVAMGSGVKCNSKTENQLRKNVELKAFSKVALPAGVQLSEDLLSWARCSIEAIAQGDLCILHRLKLQQPVSAGELISWDKVGF